MGTFQVREMICGPFTDTKVRNGFRVDFHNSLADFSRFKEVAHLSESVYWCVTVRRTVLFGQEKYRRMEAFGRLIGTFVSL